MQKRTDGFRRVFLVLSLLVAAHAHGIGLGEIEKTTYLNQPLDARIALTETTGVARDDIRVSLASHEVFARAGVGRPKALSTLRFAIVDDEAGQPVVRVTSTEPVSEPYLEFIVEAVSPNGRLLKVYTLLMNPASL